MPRGPLDRKVEDHRYVAFHATLTATGLGCYWHTLAVNATPYNNQVTIGQDGDLMRSLLMGPDEARRLAGLLIEAADFMEAQADA